ncbi:hypothetical protein GCM10011402_28910 [Paracoccus acridae]|uniref:Uncharacterized protein n=1 Tax=Paracoccus acridae TaxID=1795310 RepID=A0ABQ1VKT6_9RHOB|nr:hypothetical protein [Paracoccus acridae]GGF74492.1 hypothetical protein GCM10011402_28910 [Paracoccus acridae]
MILNDGTMDGTQILKRETVDMMAQNEMGENRVSMLTTYDPSRSADAEFFPSLEKTWGLSFMINEEVAPTGRPAVSLAWAGLRNTFFWIDRENDIGGVWVSQLLPFVDEKTIQHSTKSRLPTTTQRRQPRQRTDHLQKRSKLALIRV